MICPKCNGELKTYDFCGIKFEFCPKCGVVAISNENFNKIVQKFDKSADQVDLFSLKAVNTQEAPRKCTHCGNDMDKILYYGVLIDRCNSCKMLLFDNGELSKYFTNIAKSPIEIVSNSTFIKMYCSNTNYEKYDKDKEKEKEIEKKKEKDNNRENYYMQIQSREKEKIFNPISGLFMVGTLIFSAIVVAIITFICIAVGSGFFVIPLILIVLLYLFLLGGFITVRPQEAYVLTLFGKYVGTIKSAGFYWRNPFIKTNGYPISLKARTLDNAQQKINDEDGNPIEVGIMVTWEVKDTAMAEFNVDNYEEFLSAQCDSVLRRIIRQYPYDAPEDSNKETLRGDSSEISDKLKIEIQNAVLPAGLHIIDARITHLAYAAEIAVAMLQRQQANAILAAKRAIVDGAVSMVEMALDKLSKNENITMSDTEKTKMVNNLLVILCGNKDSQPVIPL